MDTNRINTPLPLETFPIQLISETDRQTVFRYIIHRRQIKTWTVYGIVERTSYHRVIADNPGITQLAIITAHFGYGDKAKIFSFILKDLLVDLTRDEIAGFGLVEHNRQGKTYYDVNKTPYPARVISLMRSVRQHILVNWDSICSDTLMYINKSRDELQTQRDKLLAFANNIKDATSRCLITE